MKPVSLLEALYESDPALAKEYKAAAASCRIRRCPNSPLPFEAQEKQETKEVYEDFDDEFDYYSGMGGKAYERRRAMRGHRVNFDDSEVVPSKDWEHSWTGQAPLFEHYFTFNPASKSVCPDEGIGPFNESYFGTDNTPSSRTASTSNDNDVAGLISEGNLSQEVRSEACRGVSPITQLTIAHNVGEKRSQCQDVGATSWMGTELDVVLRPWCDQYEEEGQKQQSRCDQSWTRDRRESSSSHGWAGGSEGIGQRRSGKSESFYSRKSSL